MCDYSAKQQRLSGVALCIKRAIRFISSVWLWFSGWFSVSFMCSLSSDYICDTISDHVKRFGTVSYTHVQFVTLSPSYVEKRRPYVSKVLQHWMVGRVKGESCLFTIKTQDNVYGGMKHWYCGAMSLCPSVPRTLFLDCHEQGNQPKVNFPQKSFEYFGNHTFMEVYCAGVTTQVWVSSEQTDYLIYSILYDFSKLVSPIYFAKKPSSHTPTVSSARYPKIVREILINEDNIIPLSVVWWCQQFVNSFFNTNQNIACPMCWWPLDSTV